MKKIIILVAISLLLFSCFRSKISDGEKPIARVNDTYLYLSEIEGIQYKGLPKDDSAAAVQSYINSWAKNQLLLLKANQNLKKEEINIDQLIENYRQSLIIFTYEQKLVNQDLNTLVTDLEIQDYYDNNKNNFELKENIVQVHYLITKPKAIKDVTIVKKLLTSDDEEDVEKLITLAKKHSGRCYISNNEWIMFDDLKKTIPIETYNEESFLKNNKYIHYNDSDNEYFVYIKDYKTKTGISPIEFVSSTISTIIINKRKKDLLQQIENNLYNNALENNLIEIY